LTCFLYLLLNFKKLHMPIRRVLYSSIVFCIIINFFWLFIGWYPPIRFSYYGFGNLIIFLSILIFFNLENIFSRISFFFGLTFYFIFLNHWNSPFVVEQNIFIKISAPLFIFAVIFDYYKNNLKS